MIFPHHSGNIIMGCGNNVSQSNYRDKNISQLTDRNLCNFILYEQNTENIYLL